MTTRRAETGKPGNQGKFDAARRPDGDALAHADLETERVQTYDTGSTDRIHDPHGVLNPSVVARIMALRDWVVTAGDTNSVGGPSCGVTSEELAGIIDGYEFFGAYDTGHGAPEHAWVVLRDGTIVDATADQFGMPPIVVVRPGDPEFERYLDQEGDDVIYG